MNSAGIAIAAALVALNVDAEDDREGRAANRTVDCDTRDPAKTGMKGTVPRGVTPSIAAANG